MEYAPDDSSGTDDDLPPSHHNGGLRGSHVAGNGRVAGAHSRMPNDMATQIHQLEQEAYSSVLRAFKAQSDAITWEKESLITELRKELRVSDEDHRELLSSVNADDIIRRIREWRQGSGFQSGLLNNSQPLHDSDPSPTVSASRKRQRTSQPSSLGAPSPSLHSQQVAASLQPSLSAGKRGIAAGSKNKNPKTRQALPAASSVKSMQNPPAGPSGRGQPTGASTLDPLVGRKVLTRWPEDNSFYEAVITNYNADEGLHALVYDMNTKDETWEWVNLSEIPPEDIQWQGEDLGILHRPGQGGPGRGNKKSTGRSSTIPGSSRGRGTFKNNAKKNFPPSQNGVAKKGTDDIEILHTDSVIKEVEKVLGANHLDAFELDKAKKLLKEHEQSLIDAIARLADASDGESDGEELSHGQSMERDRSNRRGTNYDDGTGDRMDYQQTEEYGI